MRLGNTENGKSRIFAVGFVQQKHGKRRGETNLLQEKQVDRKYLCFANAGDRRRETRRPSRGQVLVVPWQVLSIFGRDLNDMS